MNVEIRATAAMDLEGFDAVIPLVGLPNDPLGDLDPTLTFELNHAASVRLAEQAKASGAPRFLASHIDDAYKPAKISEKILTGPRFVRMNQLKQLMDDGNVSDLPRWTYPKQF